VTRIYEPGHKFDFVPILEGAQGIRKSTFIKTLAMGFFGNLTANFNNDQKLIEQIKNSWVIEIPELGNMSRSGVEDAKAFFSMGETRVREAYGSRAGVFKRQCVFMGSTNKGEYLRDSTGNRRFWPLKVTATTIDTVALEGEMLQVWAEVATWYHDARRAQPYGELPLYLTNAEAQAEALAQQESRREAGDAATWAGQIEEFLNTPFKTSMESKTWLFREETCHQQLFDEVLGMGTGRKTVMDYDNMKEALNIAGWELTGNSVKIGSYGKQQSYARKRKLSAERRKALIAQHIATEAVADPPDDDESLL
jgi:predicted P-loop ATPase